MPITQDNALIILPLLEDWQGGQSTRSQQQRNLNQDSSGYKVLHPHHASPVTTIMLLLCYSIDFALMRKSSDYYSFIRMNQPLSNKYYCNGLQYFEFLQMCVRQTGCQSRPVNITKADIQQCLCTLHIVAECQTQAGTAYTERNTQVAWKVYRKYAECGIRSSRVPCKWLRKTELRSCGT